MITEAIFEWARRTPEKTAVIYNDRRWSYRSFAEHVAIARAYFLKRGLSAPAMRCMPPSPAGKEPN
jgi:acyl-CoA synthetase (AMP-forming)/AMP-acid ligase II